MNLPFSEQAFLELFGDYNRSVWPIVAGMWVATAWLVARWWRGAAAGRALSLLLAVHWAWSGLAYHWAFFTRINPAALAFAALFVAQALLFGWHVARRDLEFRTTSGMRGIIARGLAVYALMYPVIGFACGLRPPEMPLFAVPCPTTLLTTAILLTATSARRSLLVLPLIWAVIGTSAAVALGVRADWMLGIAAVLLLIDLVSPDTLGARGFAAPAQ